VAHQSKDRAGDIFDYIIQHGIPYILPWGIGPGNMPLPINTAVAMIDAILKSLIFLPSFSFIPSS